MEITTMKRKRKENEKNRRKIADGGVQFLRLVRKFGAKIGNRKTSGVSAIIWYGSVLRNVNSIKTFNVTE
jgi:hypothetical protein